MSEAGRPGQGQHIVIMTGPAGAGRTTAIGALEDIGFEAIDNLPISFLRRLFAGGAVERSMVIGIDPRNRDFSVDRMLSALGEVEAAAGRPPVLVYLDCDAVTLLERYSETRRRHPLSPRETAAVGIERELALLAPLRERADVLIDTRGMTPHELRAEMGRQFGEEMAANGALAVTLQSFSYRRGLPRGADMVIDVRFLRNPHWDQRLRPLDGRDEAVRAFVESDPSYAPFYMRITDLLEFLLPAYQMEGKSYFGLGLGCTGGRHRSVAVAEALAKTLAGSGWRVSIRHRDLERAAGGAGSDLGVGAA
ncbi:RNase adapter RapZ [Amaricoccus sp.]|uniref:RNase adapter RapZ n=1 Tax=Amaricoccus sp. TaxID=1872485 RepID=UPI0026059C30|nr:RNase adapter RapZ [Amaricoccus sp.]HRO10451.1 RNase adapter RapZ [Amaricoccus sp.]